MQYILLITKIIVILHKMVKWNVHFGEVTCTFVDNNEVIRRKDGLILGSFCQQAVITLATAGGHHSGRDKR